MAPLPAADACAGHGLRRTRIVAPGLAATGRVIFSAVPLSELGTMSLSRRRSWASGLVLALAASAASAQGARPLPVASPPPVAGTLEVATDSPRASLADFLALAKRGRYAEAATYLDLAPAEQADGPELARRLKAVLDRYLEVDLDSLSPLALGNEQDGLPPGVDQIGVIPLAGRLEPVRILRRRLPGGDRWRFSSSTVERIDEWYEAMGDRWIRRHLPDWLLRIGPGKLLRWQWLALVLLVATAYPLARLLAWPARRLTAYLVSRTRTPWDDAIVDRLRGLWTVLGMWIVIQSLLPWLDLSPSGEALIQGFLRVAAILTVFGVFYRAVDVLDEGLGTLPWALSNPSARSALAIATRSAKAAVLLLGVIAALIQLGYPVASVLAGLGIGGLALALAAQKTVENLFGSVSLAADEAVRLGDTVRIDTLLGTVEGIGLRSTRLRTRDRTLVTIPNGLLAGQRIESLTARDRMRLHCTLGLVYGTSASQMREVLASCERILRAQPKVWPHDLSVRFNELGASSLDVEVNAWFEAPWEEFTGIRQDVLLQFLEAVEAAGTSLAFPTQTVHVVTPPAPTSDPR
jgi:MscS family membrane protein